MDYLFLYIFVLDIRDFRKKASLYMNKIII